MKKLLAIVMFATLSAPAIAEKTNSSDLEVCGLLAKYGAGAWELRHYGAQPSKLEMNEEKTKAVLAHIRWEASENNAKYDRESFYDMAWRYCLKNIR